MSSPSRSNDFFRYSRRIHLVGGEGAPAVRTGRKDPIPTQLRMGQKGRRTTNGTDSVTRQGAYVWRTDRFLLQVYSGPFPRHSGAGRRPIRSGRSFVLVIRGQRTKTKRRAAVYRYGIVKRSGYEARNVRGNGFRDRYRVRFIYAKAVGELPTGGDISEWPGPPWRVRYDVAN